MKKEDMLRSLGEIDDEFIAEAAPVRKKRTVKWYKITAIAACIAMFVAANLWLFLPNETKMPDPTPYEGTEYYTIIEKLSPLFAEVPEYDTNFDMILDGIGGATAGDIPGMMAPGADTGIENGNTAVDDSYASGESTGSYEEITDNQVEGVVEADLIKRSNTHIFYLNVNSRTMFAYSIDGENSVCVGSYKVTSPDGFSYVDWEFYLSNDCKTATIIAPYSSKNTGAATAIISLDVSDPTSITEKSHVSVAGSYLSSRVTGGKILLISSYYINNPDFGKPETFVPQIDTGEGMKPISTENIFYPETLTSKRYTVVAKLDEESLTLDGCSAFLSYSNEVYVSADSVYTTRSYTKQTAGNGTVTAETMTEIARLYYAGESFEYKGSVSVAGNIKNQYSLDEYEGILRVVTTTSRSTTYTRGDLYSSADTLFSNGTNASLYCIDLSTLEVAAKVENFAPWGETVESVRFDKNYAYVCTAVKVTLTDPVFFFDLSNLENITYKDTGVIEGYSSSLINLGGGFLLGIGVSNSWDTLKVEVYEESENGVVSVCTYELENVGYSEDYKSYYVDRENRLFGFGIESYSNMYEKEWSRYILLHFDNFNLYEVVNVALDGSNHLKRGVYIDGYFYMFGDNDFKVVAVQ